MPRPRNCRRIHGNHNEFFFKPQGIPLCELEIENLKVDELEAMKLAYIDELYQEEAAKIMGVSRATFARTLSSANKKGNFEHKQRKVNKMKIAITSLDNNLDGGFSKHFGRCKSFVIYNLEDDSFEIIDNYQNLNATHGAGIQAAETIINTDVFGIISGDFGPKAYKVLKMNDIKMFKSDATTIKEVIELFKQEQIQEFESEE